MSQCSRGEALPMGWPEVGILYVSPPLAHTRGALRRLLWESGLPFGDPLDDITAVEVTPEDLSRLCDLLLRGLSTAELEDCRAVLVEKGSPPGLGMLSRMQNLGTLAAAVKAEWLVDILREDRMIVHFQPIVRTADPEQVFAYECLLQGFDRQGAFVNSKRMFDVARQTGLLYYLDRAARTKSIWEASDLDLHKVFINFDPAAIYNPQYCLRSTIGAVERSHLSHEQVVFEVTQSEAVKDQKHLRKVLHHYRACGFKISLDDLSASRRSLTLLETLLPDFVKLDMALVRHVDRNPHHAALASKLLDLARDLGTTVIAEGVETEEQWRWLGAHGVDLAQGYFFARPDYPPPLPTHAYAQSKNAGPGK